MKTFYEFVKIRIPPRTRNIDEAASNPHSLTPTDIYDFYYLCTALSFEQINVQDYTVAEFYLREIREMYLNVFSELLTQQIEKYVKRGRVDIIQGKPTFDANQLKAMPLNQRFALIKQQIAQTYRSDMQRRNDVWDTIADHLDNLSRYNDAKKICYYIDRINNSVHNTKTNVLDKLPNGQALLHALDIVHESRTPESYRQFVSREVRRLMKIWYGPGRNIA